MEEEYTSESEMEEYTSESEMEEYTDKVYQTLKKGKLKATVSSELVCPYCPKTKKVRTFRFKVLLQHAESVGHTNSKKRSVKERARHLALFKYLQDLDDSSVGKESSSKRRKTEVSIEIGELEDTIGRDEKIVRPWKGIVVNIPTTRTGGQSVGQSGSELREEYIQRGFNPIRVLNVWNHWGHQGKAIVDFNNDWKGLENAVLFEKAYRIDNHGKKDWLTEDGPKSGLYAWIARADDFNDTGIIGERLRKMCDLKTIAEIKEDEMRKQQLLEESLTQDKKKDMKESEEHLLRYMEVQPLSEPLPPPVQVGEITKDDLKQYGSDVSEN